MRNRVVFIVLGIIIFVVLLAGIKKSRNSEPGSSKAVPQCVEQAESAALNGDLNGARNIYLAALAENKNSAEVVEIQKRLQELNIQLLFSPTIDECSVLYTVAAKDSLTKIAKKHGTTIELIMFSNNLTSDVIRLGQKLKVVTCKFAIVVDKSQNLLFLKFKDKDEIIKTYTVSTGKDLSTPEGVFKIVNKLIDPVWYKAGAIIAPDSPENILGTRWLGLDAKGYGIHGTTKPEELGQQVTLGCVRMSNEEVEELFAIVPKGTEVTIVE